MSRISWRKLARVSAAFGILLFVYCAVYYCSPDKYEVTEYARTEWSKEFREVGLDKVPEHAKYGGASSYENYGHWDFRADIPRVRQWLSHSQSLRTAEVKTKPGKKAYLFYSPAAHRTCLVTVFFSLAPHWKPGLSDGEAWVMVDTIDIDANKNRSTCRTQAVNEALENLAHLRDSRSMWAEN